MPEVNGYVSKNIGTYLKKGSLIKVTGRTVE